VISTVTQSQGAVDDVVSLAEGVAEHFTGIGDKSMSMAHTISGLAAVISQQRGAVESLAGHMQVVSNKSARNVAGVEKLAIEGWRSTLAAENIENKVLYLAQADHLLWKKRLLDMATGRSKLKSSELTDHTLCRLGKWYYNEGNRYANLPSFAAIEEPHKKVHFHGIEAAKCFETQRLDEGMVHYRQLDAASHEVLAQLANLAQQSVA